MKHIIQLALLTLLLGACSRETPAPDTGAASAQPPAKPETPSTGATINEKSARDLGDTSWRLVQIMSMNDTTQAPDNPDLYMLTFNADGTMNLLADCNRASGSWTSENESQLKFGPMAATMAMCPEGSLHDVYLAQFGWVRSYVINDGHLFLATMADGAIIEFEPLDSE